MLPWLFGTQLTVFVRLQQDGRAAGSVTGGGKAQSRAKVPGELPESADQSCVPRTGVVWRDGHYLHIFWGRLGPQQQLCANTHKSDMVSWFSLQQAALKVFTAFTCWLSITVTLVQPVLYYHH